MYIEVAKNGESPVAKETGVISSMSYRGVLIVPNTHQQERRFFRGSYSGPGKRQRFKD